MRTLVKHGLLAASVAALALGCGSSNTSSQPAVSTTENTQATTYTTSAEQPAPTAQGYGAYGSPQQQQQGMAQGNMGGTDQPGTTTTSEGTMGGKQVTTLSDAEIYAIEDAANTGEIQMAELAKKTATSQQVKDYAAMMITHHKDANTKLKAIGKKDNITSKDNDTSNKLKSDVSSMMTDLRSKKGKDFDRAYIDDQVTAHRSVLDIVDNQLLPSVKDADLKSHLADVRRKVADHLSKAEDIQQKMQSVGTMEPASGTTKGKAGTKTKGTTTPAPSDTNKGNNNMP
jgi:putative membrane protein